LVWCQYLSRSSCTHTTTENHLGAISPSWSVEQPIQSDRGTQPESAARKGCAVATQPSGNAATTYPSYLRTAEVADILHVSPKTISRWAKEGKLPFLRTLGGHRRYPEAKIRELAEELREEAMT